ncbi:MAG TPA: hypothetical protein VMU00_01730, partial [Steroidobacteraceae bacterium]|nr:hypothetical protein [Steroidobacteraceae bacterium]
MGALPATAQTPTAEQLKALDNLPAAQRDAILQQLTGGRGTTQATGGAQQDQITVLQAPGAAESEVGVPVREPRIKGHEQLLIQVAVPDAVPAGAKRARLEELRDRIVSRNPFELTSLGVLQIPGFDPIPLAGLTAKEAQERLALDPLLRDVTLAVTVLRLEAQGVRALKPFGYDMFRGSATAFV